MTTQKHYDERVLLIMNQVRTTLYQMNEVYHQFALKTQSLIENPSFPPLAKTKGKTIKEPPQKPIPNQQLLLFKSQKKTKFNHTNIDNIENPHHCAIAAQNPQNNPAQYP